MDISLFFEVRTAQTDPGSVERVYRQTIEQVVLADQLGYKTAWFAEHHFRPEWSHSSVPELFLAHLAAKTSRIRLGHAIVLLPFKINHPVRVAERIAALDILSNGRVEFGGGRAISEAELSGFAVDPEATRPQMEEALRMLPRMWMDEKFSWNSKDIQISPRAITPKPLQRPHPPMWVACTQPATIEFAAANGLGVLGFGIGQGQSHDYVKLYKSKIGQAAPIGAFVNPRFAVLQHALCCPTDEEALAIQGPDFKKTLDYARVLFAPWIDGRPPHSYEWVVKNFSESYQQVQKLTTQDIVKAGGACIGSPQTCMQVLQYLNDCGVDEVLLLMQGFTTPHDAVMHSLELIAREVRPKLKAEITPEQGAAVVSRL